MMTEYVEIRFGAVAIKKGFVTPNQILKAMNIQVAEDLNNGNYKPIELILLDEKLITGVQIEKVRRCIGDDLK